MSSTDYSRIAAKIQFFVAVQVRKYLKLQGDMERLEAMEGMMEFGLDMVSASPEYNDKSEEYTQNWMNSSGNMIGITRQRMQSALNDVTKIKRLSTEAKHTILEQHPGYTREQLCHELNVC